jgi:gliding motility-associated protein GldL
MKNLITFLFKTKKGKQIMGMIYGLGAAVVIVGAWAKILHLPIANVMITVGLLTEALIFVVSAFEPPHEEIDWSLVYPELAGEEGHGDGHGKGKSVKGGTGVTQELDKLMEEAKIDSVLIQSLGDGMRKLSETTNGLSNVSDASLATNEFVSNVKSASSNMGKLSESYVKASESLMAISTADGQNYGEELQRVSKNLSALNSVYELQIQGTKEYVESSAKAYNNINELLKYLDASVDDTKRYKDEIHKLGNNLSALNTVYGNMLAAMNVNR